MKLFLGVSVVFCVTGLVCSIQSFNYESMHNFGVGNRPIPGVRRQLSVLNSGYAYPQAIEVKKKKKPFFPDPYPSITQGKREYEDVRVIKRNFHYPAAAQGQKVTCEKILYCTISYISVETSKGIPFILRGGAGYQHFSVVVRSTPGSPLSGTIRVYCRKNELLDPENGTSSVP